MNLTANLHNLQPREHQFLSSVLAIFCDPKHAALRADLIKGRAGLRYDRSTPEREIKLPALTNVTTNRN